MKNIGYISRGGNPDFAKLKNFPIAERSLATKEVYVYIELQ